MILADLDRRAVAERLRSAGLRLRTGPVVFELRSPLHSVADAVSLHYARHEVVDQDDFADFHIHVRPARGLRRWYRPQSVFEFDAETPFAPLPLDQAFPMLEWGMNWCVSSHCHQFLIVHAAVLERSGRALVLPAPAGSGKSTLCAALALSGSWRLLSDELALLDPSSGLVVPLPRPISLKNRSIDVIRSFSPHAAMSREVRETVKGRVTHLRPPESAVTRGLEPALPAWIVLPRYEEGAATALQPVSRASAFMALVDNAFNYHVHGRRGFSALVALIDRCACHSLAYSELAGAMAALHTLVSTPARR